MLSSPSSPIPTSTPELTEELGGPGGRHRASPSGAAWRLPPMPTRPPTMPPSPAGWRPKRARPSPRRSLLPRTVGPSCATARTRIRRLRSTRLAAAAASASPARSQLQGKALSYNNLNDTDAALELVAEFQPPHFDQAAVAIIKHANPCGVASGGEPGRGLRQGPGLRSGQRLRRHRRRQPASRRRHGDGDRQALHRSGDRPGSGGGGASRARREGQPAAPGDRRPAGPGGARLGAPQPRRRLPAAAAGQRHRSPARTCAASPSASRARAQLDDLLFAFRVAKHVKSNAIVYVRDGATVGIGAGQMSRVDSSRIAAWKGKEAVGTAGSVVASDAFFPFADGLLGRRRGRRRSRHPARRLLARRGGHRGGRRGRHRHGHDRHAPLPALMLT